MNAKWFQHHRVACSLSLYMSRLYQAVHCGHSVARAFGERVRVHLVSSCRRAGSGLVRSYTPAYLVWVELWKIQGAVCKDCCLDQCESSKVFFLKAKLKLPNRGGAMGAAFTH